MRCVVVAVVGAVVVVVVVVVEECGEYISACVYGVSVFKGIRVLYVLHAHMDAYKRVLFIVDGCCCCVGFLVSSTT